ncbi:hypothetical protein RUM43_002141 [Polyplax serrata]|uniref:Uncharacterized protein n=1 Tax=Polyplax serrata TaxID=468196 RepID=A0AAN8S5S7_POLSC
MGDKLIDFCEEATPTPANDTNEEECHDFPQPLVTEKIIFCVDALLLSKEDNSNTVIYNLLKSYFVLKKKICVKVPEFECLIIGSGDTIVHFNINSAKDIQSALKFVDNVKYDEEKNSLELDNVFGNIAPLVELPDPECHDKCIPPNWVYHVIWLFGRNIFVPTMTNSNPFDFVMGSPYFALDILYVYDNTLKNNCCEEISHSLFSLNQNGKGYFLNARYNDCAKIYSCFAQFLGHPLIRSSQIRAKFSVIDLGPQSESENCKENDGDN